MVGEIWKMIQREDSKFGFCAMIIKQICNQMKNEQNKKNEIENINYSEKVEENNQDQKLGSA